MARLPDLDLDQMVGQMLVLDMFGEAELDLLRRYRAGSVTVRRKHVKSIRQLVRLVNRHQEEAVLPLIVGAEFEWGVGVEVPSATVFPGLLAIGASKKKKTAVDFARVTAREAALLGINQILLPVLDVDPGNGSAATSIRSFGEDPERVAAIGRTMVETFEKNRVLSTARHFPVAADDHLMPADKGLPVAGHDRKYLEETALPPYRQAMEAGLRSVQVSNVYLPALCGDEPVPAALSPDVVQSFLRERMGFDGLIMTGNLSDDAVAKRYGSIKACREAIRAGCDLLLTSREFLKPSQVLDLVRAVKRDKILVRRVEEASARILEAKNRLGLFKGDSLSVDEANEGIGSDTNQHAAHRAALSGTVVLRKSRGALPLKAKKSELILVVTPKLPESTITGVKDNWGHLYRAVKEFHPETRPAYVGFSPSKPEVQKTLRAVDRADHVIAVMAHEQGDQADGKQAELIDKVIRARSSTIVAVLGSPYPARAISEKAAAVLLTFSNMEVSQAACAEIILGKARPGGRMPVSL